MATIHKSKEPNLATGQRAQWTTIFRIVLCFGDLLNPRITLSMELLCEFQCTEFLLQVHKSESNGKTQPCHWLVPNTIEEKT